MPDERAVLDHRQAAVAPARHELARLAHRRLGRDGAHRATIAMSPARSGARDLGLERLAHSAHEPRPPTISRNRGRRRLRVSSAAEPRHHGADVDLGEAGCAPTTCIRSGIAMTAIADADSPCPRRRSASARSPSRRTRRSRATPTATCWPLTSQTSSDAVQLSEQLALLGRRACATRNWLTTSRSAPARHEERGGVRVVRGRPRIRERPGVLVDAEQHHARLERRQRRCRGRRISCTRIDVVAPTGSERSSPRVRSPSGGGWWS